MVHRVLKGLMMHDDQLRHNKCHLIFNCLQHSWWFPKKTVLISHTNDWGGGGDRPPLPPLGYAPEYINHNCLLSSTDFNLI